MYKNIVAMESNRGYSLRHAAAACRTSEIKQGPVNDG